MEKSNLAALNVEAENGADSGRPSAESPIPASRYEPQALANAERVCRACGSITKQGHRCKDCGRFLPSNQVARTNGSTARHQPAEVLMNADQLLDAIVGDLGGAGNMSAIQRSLAAKLRDCDVLLTLNKNLIVRSGLESNAGRKAHERFLAGLDRFTRIALALGLERKPRHVDPRARLLEAMGSDE